MIKRCWSKNFCEFTNPNICCHECKKQNCEMRCKDNLDKCKFVITEEPIKKVVEKEEPKPEAYTITEISNLLNRTYDEIYNLVYYKQIDFYKKGRLYQIPKTELEKIRRLLNDRQ